MFTRVLSCSFRRSAQRPESSFRHRTYRGLTLLELLVVLFIISVMAGLLFPAIQSARGTAHATACQNNLRQLGQGLRQCVATSKRFPAPNRWTVDILKWIEEWPLANEFAGGIPKNVELSRPPLYRCPSQPEFDSTVPNARECHYLLAVDRRDQNRVGWELHDRPILSEQDPHHPWFVGPEISFDDQREMFSTMRGPHLSGMFYTNSGTAHEGH